jgi:hypothetical protein
MVTYTYGPGEWAALAKTWLNALKADNKSANTIRIYLHAVRLLGVWASQQPKPLEPATTVLARTSEGNAHNQYRSLRTFFRFLVDEEEISTSPMDRNLQQ